MSDSKERPRREAPPSFLPPGWDPAAPAPRYAMGKRVRLGAGAADALRGVSGVVERVAGHFAPEPGADKAPLYRVRIALCDLWGDRADGFEREDTLDLELFEGALNPFFDYTSFDAEKRRLEAALRDSPAIDEDARLAALTDLTRASGEQAQIVLQPIEGARHIVLAQDLAPSLRRETLRRPRATVERFGGEPPREALRLHLATGRISYQHL